MTERSALRHTLRSLAGLLNHHQRRRFLLLALLAAGNAILEAVAAGFVLALITAATSDTATSGHGTADPVGSVIRSLLPGDASRRAITVTIGLSTLVFYLLKNISGVIEQYLQQRMVHQTAGEASTAVVTRYLRVPLALHYRQRSGDMLQHAWTATEQVFRNSLLAAVALFSEALAALALLSVLVAAAPVATGAVAVTMSVLVGVMYVSLRPATTRWSRELQEYSMESFQSVQESFGAVRDARILGVESYFEDRYRRSRAALARTFWRSGTATNAPRFVLEGVFITTMVVAVLLLSGGGARPTSVSVLGLYAYAGLRLMPSLNRVLFALGTIRLGGQAIDDVRGALSLPSEPDPHGPPVPEFRRELILEALTYRHPESDVAAVDDVSLTIRQGEAVGIVGPSGSGKSTLVDLIVGLLEPERGRVLVDGVDASTNLASWRTQIGYVSQTCFMLDDSVRINVAFGVADDAIDDARVWEVLAQAQVDGFVRGLPAQLDTTLGERGVRLSGGQRQRLAIARALYRDPRVLVLDEATSSLDNRTEEEIVAALEALARTRTVLVIAHRLTTVRACDRIAFMQRGTVVACASYGDLVAEDERFRDFVSSGQWAP